VAAGFLRVATGVEPPDDLIRAFDGALILRADNELNPGTFAARVAASTGADLTSCVTSALGALAGPKHSGHTIAVARLLESIGDPRQAASAVSQALATTTKPAGFGHPVYKGEDPRTPMARRLAEMAALATSRDDLFESAQAVEQEVHRQSGLYANVDYYLTVIYLAAGLPVAAFAPIFAMARTPGWIAHVLEQQEDPELIRPRARYEGERNQKLPARRQRASPAQPKQPKPTPT
jgi:citrate synthase